MQNNRGVTDEELQPIDVTEPAAPLPVARLPPYNGFGSLVSHLLRIPSDPACLLGRDVTSCLVWLLTCSFIRPSKQSRAVLVHCQKPPSPMLAAYHLRIRNFCSRHRPDQPAALQEDSAQNCAGLQLKPPKKDFYKLMNKAKVVLRFKVVFAATGPQPMSAVDR